MPALLRHVVLMGFNAQTTPEQTTEIVRRFTALKDLVDGVEDFECGPNNSTEGLDRGHSHCFFLTFASEAARDAYLPHPAHQEFVAFIKPHLENVTVIDYWTQS